VDLGLCGKNALVMGASSGIGKAIAQAFISEGANVIICARNQERLQAAAEEIGAKATTCDLQTPGAAENLVKQAHEALGSLDILVTNTGGPPKGYFTELQSGNSGSFMDKMEFFVTFLQKDSIKTFEEAREKYGADETLGNKMAFNGSKSALKVIAQPGSWINDTIAKLPLVIFFFLPIFTVFILLVYIRKKHTYTDHLIFSFHNQSLLFILLILSWIIDSIFNTATAWIALTLFSIYLFQAMRKFYGQGVFKTIIKYLFLNSVFLFLALISVVLLFTGSIFTY